LNADLVVFNNKVLFAGLDASNQTELWVTDGTAAGTHELTGISGAFTVLVVCLEDRPPLMLLRLPI
jgi:ELWxxDGT repeat protein